MGRGGYTVTYAEDLTPTVKFFPSGETITGKEAQRHINKVRGITGVLGIVFLPLSLLFAVVVGIHNATGWVIDKVFNGRDG